MVRYSCTAPCGGVTVTSYLHGGDKVERRLGVSRGRIAADVEVPMQIEVGSERHEGLGHWRH